LRQAFRALAANYRNLIAVGLLLTIVSFGLHTGRLPISPVANADNQRMVSLYVDGTKRLFATNDTTVGAVVKHTGIKLAAGDLVEPSDSTSIAPGQFNINIYRARPVFVVDGSQHFRLESAYQSPHLLAQAAGLNVYPEDNYKTSVITNFVATGAIGEQVSVKRATPFLVKVDGKIQTVRTQATTVGAALDSAGIALGLKDTVAPGTATPVIAGETVQITRVTEALATITETIPRPVQTVIDPTVLKGQTSVRTPGTDGHKTTTYLIHYTDGVETNRTPVQVINQTAPTAQVIVVGTKVIFAGNVEYWRPQVVAAATQYGLDPNMMLRIMQCESNGNASDVSAFVVDGQHPTGLFQYLPTTWIAAGGTADNIFDGSLQIQLTAKKMAAQGTKAWACQ